MAERHLIAGQPGVYYREAPRAGGMGTEKVYYIRYRREGRQIEEKAGRQHRDRMTPARAQRIRAMRIEGREPSNAERRKAARQESSPQGRNAGGTVGEIWESFARARMGNRSFRDDRTRYRLYIQLLLAERRADSLTRDDVEKLGQKVEQGGRARQTVLHILALLKRILNFALREGLTESVSPPVLNFRLPAADNARTESLDREQAARLVRALDEEKNQVQAGVVRLALFTGMRKSAILQLKWKDLDFERGFITLRGETAKKRKTEVIPMNDGARQALEGLPRTSEYVFPGRDGKKPLVNINALLARVRQKAGLPPDFRPLHGLRHTFASWLASSGKVTMYELQRLLTHSSPMMTQRYAHLHDSALKKASQLASGLFEKAGEAEIPGQDAPGA